jgi:serine/threonine-protein kinase PknG
LNIALAGTACTQGGCGGTVLADGYCNTCGTAATAPAPAAARAESTGQPPTAITIAAPSAPQLSNRVSAAVASTAARRSAATRRSTTEGLGLGLGLVTVAPTPVGDPAQALMSAEKIQAVLDEVPEDERFCRNCDSPVGRGRDGVPGRTDGFCGTCRTPFNFVSNTPALKPGDLVANQYEILGPLAHGGMGWIYLGKDKAVSDRWVVLKGLLDEADTDAIASAVAERQFLAQIEHGSIVNIYNFVTWGSDGNDAGYIVMEYVGGASLNSKLKQLRRETGDPNARMPLTEAISYIIGVLPAMGYLHDQGLVYNDLKPANVMATANDVKLIDLGGVMRRDDESAAIFGTQGFQAAEVASAGPSVPSDLYTVGRTLAVLAMPFSFHQGAYLHEIPPASEQPLLARHESFHRFLLKATARHPDDRFQTAEGMRVQLTGVLREVVATTTGTPRPTPSSLFGGDQLTELLVDDNRAADKPNWRSLPRPRVNPTDSAASFLLSLPTDDAEQAHVQLSKAVNEQQVPWTHEAAFVSAMTAIEANRDPAGVLESLSTVDPWDWRIRWIEGLQAIVQKDPGLAADRFSQVWTQLPGEIAPKLAVGLAAEMAGEFRRAAQVYQSVIATDPTYVTASFGLARCRVAGKDRKGAVSAYQSVPPSSAGYFDARIAAARAHVEPIGGVVPSKDDVVAAVRIIEGVQLDTIERAEISVQVLEQALSGLLNGAIKTDEKIKVFGQPLTERGVRSELESTYRELGRLASDRDERIRLVDLANSIRMKSLV